MRLINPKAFSKYGNLMDVVLDSKGLAYIFFSNVKSAKQAEFDFNRQYINENDTRLVVDFCNDLESNYAWGLLKQKKAPVLKTSSRSYQEPTATNPPGLAIATSVNLLNIASSYPLTSRLMCLNLLANTRFRSKTTESSKSRGGSLAQRATI